MSAADCDAVNQEAMTRNMYRICVLVSGKIGSVWISSSQIESERSDHVALIYFDHDLRPLNLEQLAQAKDKRDGAGVDFPKVLSIARSKKTDLQKQLPHGMAHSETLECFFFSLVCGLSEKVSLTCQSCSCIAAVPQYLVIKSCKVPLAIIRSPEADLQAIFDLNIFV